MALPLMPKATAVWLVENTSLTFDQIADFCGLHVLEVKGIADGEVATGIVGLDPVANGQIAAEELDRCQADPAARLKLIEGPVPLTRPKSKGARYTPVSKRQDRPDAIAWILKFHPEISDAQIQKLLGTTKSTIQSVRDRTHWNSSGIKPRDPVSLGICTQTELDGAVTKAAAKKRGKDKSEAEPTVTTATLIRPEPVVEPQPTLPTYPADQEEDEEPTAEKIFGIRRSE